MRLLKYKIFCITEQTWHETWQEEGSPTPTVCPIDSSHEVDLDSVSVEEIRDNNQVEVTSMPAFASKTLGTKSLYKRVVGIQETLATGENELFWVCPFTWVKFMALEVINCEALDTVSLYVLDTTEGTYTQVANYVMNQFGFTANMSKDFYKHQSEFDADLYQGLQIKIVYNSLSVKNVGINFVMNEVKN